MNIAIPTKIRVAAYLVSGASALFGARLVSWLAAEHWIDGPTLTLLNGTLHDLPAAAAVLALSHLTLPGDDPVPVVNVAVTAPSVPGTTKRTTTRKAAR